MLEDMLDSNENDKDKDKGKEGLPEEERRNLTPQEIEKLKQEAEERIKAHNQKKPNKPSPP